jgi:hypothetical protein
MTTVCYCYGYTDDAIVADVRANNGRSTIEEHIAREKAGGRCQCEAKNPAGT